jgi:Dullard-like phosphatase family protein
MSENAVKLSITTMKMRGRRAPTGIGSRFLATSGGRSSVEVVQDRLTTIMLRVRTPTWTGGNEADAPLILQETLCEEQLVEGSGESPSPSQSPPQSQIDSSSPGSRQNSRRTDSNLATAPSKTMIKSKEEEQLDENEKSDDGENDKRRKRARKQPPVASQDISSEEMQSQLQSARLRQIRTLVHSQYDVPMHAPSQGPFLSSPRQASTPATILLDLDETLVFCVFANLEEQESSRGDPSFSFHIDQPNAKEEIHVWYRRVHCWVRDGVEDFLERLCRNYEVVIFTAALRPYALPLVAALEKWLENQGVRGVHFQAVLTRECCTPATYKSQRVFVKDLSRIGRDLSSLLLVDNCPLSFQLQAENGILVPSFVGSEPADRHVLANVLNIIRSVASQPDIRIALQKYKSTTTANTTSPKASTL